MNYKKVFQDMDLTTINKFFAYVQKIQYGWVDQKGYQHIDDMNAKNYSLQAPEEVLKSNLGICWDITELQRCFFETMTSFQYETYYLFYDDDKGCPCHTILVYYDNHKVYWFEPMFAVKGCYYSGIHEYNTLPELLDDAHRQIIRFFLYTNMIKEDYDRNKFYLYKYNKPNYHINGFEMRQHINRSTFIDRKQGVGNDDPK